jgi:hypothetical protein
MKNGSSVPYATVKLEQFEFLPNVNVTYLGQSSIKPRDMVERYGKVYTFIVHSNR